MSQPPVTRERRVVYTDFSLLGRGDEDPGEARIRRVREQAFKTVSQEPVPVPAAVPDEAAGRKIGAGERATAGDH